MAEQFFIEAWHFTGMEKVASTAKDEVKSIMARIYNENPSYWPYGLDISGHTDVYLIRDGLTKKACGFVGWQEHTSSGKKVGSYTIGILPEYRNNGYARAAVASVLDKKASACDKVCAYVMPDNSASKALAKSLNVDVYDVPGVKSAGLNLGSIGKRLKSSEENIRKNIDGIKQTVQNQTNQYVQKNKENAVMNVLKLFGNTIWNHFTAPTAEYPEPPKYIGSYM